MNVKTLKKQLMAAIAMVLVAAVALASSTFAWFVSNNTVTATVSSIQAQSNVAFLTIDNENTMADAGTHTDVTLTSNPVALYPSRPHQAVDGTTTDWTATTSPADLVWQTAYAKEATSANVQVDSNGKGIYYDLTATADRVTGTDGYVITSQVYVSSSQGAFTQLKLESMTVAEATGASDAKEDIVNAVGALVSCENEWELWEYSTDGEKWTQTTRSTNTLSGADATTFGDSVTENKVLTVNITLFYDGDYETISTNNLDNLGQAKVTLGFTATPVQQGVNDNYT